MKRCFILSLFVLFALCCAARLSAVTDKTGTTAVPFLKIGVGAAQASLGGAYTAIADDVNTVFWNNAGLGTIKSRDLSFTNLMYVQEVTMQSLAFAYPIGNGALGAGYTQLGAGDMTKTSDTGADEGKFTATDSMMVLSYGRTLEGLEKSTTGYCKLSYGLGLKTINSRIETYSASAFAIDLGMRLEYKSGMCYGISIQNLGNEIKFIESGFALPMMIKLGISYNKLLKGDMLVALDINIPSDNNPGGALGLQYKKDFSDNLGIAARLGYQSGIDLLGVAAGVGFVIKKNYAVDIGYAPMSDFGNAIRMSLSAKF